MNRYLSRFDALCNWYTSYKQRLHVHLGDREYRRLLLGVPQTPSFGKRNELFYNNITSYFRNRTPPKQGASSNHKGIDIGASMGAQVIATAAGKVTTVSYNSARGYFIVVDHGSGYVTLYQHLSRQDVKVGVSGQFATTTTADYYAALRTYIETCRRNGINEFDALIRLSDGNPYTVEEIIDRK